MRQNLSPLVIPRLDKPQIGVLVDASFGYGRAVLRGILRYSRTHGPWKLMANLHGLRWPYPWDNLRLDGVIGTLWDAELDQRLHQKSIPVINVSSARQPQPFAGVWPDNVAIGGLAARDLLARGFRQFAYFSDPRIGWSPDRGRGFADTLAVAGHGCFVFQPGELDTTAPHHPFPGLHDWISQLPKPIGVFCGDEYQAWTFIGTCQDVQADVPEHVAVIAAGNDELVCEACDVPLSGIDFGAERVGYEAAALLDHLMSDPTAVRPESPLLVPPVHVITRRSSDVLAIADPSLAAVLRMIHDHACQPLSVTDILEAVPVNRRWLERQFRQVLGRTIHHEILRVRLERASQLLRDTDLKLEQIAERTGFPSGQHFGQSFRKSVGMSPGTYRRRMRSAWPRPVAGALEP